MSKKNKPEENEKPNYFGILPASVRYDNEVLPRAKVLFTEFTALSNKYGYCNAKNSYFAALYGVTEQAVSKWVTNLRNQKHIETEYIYEGKEIKERRIYPISTPIGVNERFRGGKREVNGVSTTGLGGINERTKGNSTSINNTSINNNTHTKEAILENEILEVNTAFKEFTTAEKNEVTPAENLPPQEIAIKKALKKAKLFFKNYPGMEKTLKDAAKIRDPDFDIFNQLEKWIRHHGTEAHFLRSIDTKISSSFGKWLMDYRPTKIINYGKDNRTNKKTSSGRKQRTGSRLFV